MEKARVVCVVGRELLPRGQGLANLVELIVVGCSEGLDEGTIMEHWNAQVHCVEEKGLEGFEALMSHEDRLVAHQVRQTDTGHHHPANVGNREVPRNVGLEELVLGRRLPVVNREAHGVPPLADFTHNAEGNRTVAGVAKVAFDDAGAPREGLRQMGGVPRVHGDGRLGPRGDGTFFYKDVQGSRIPDVGNSKDRLACQKF